jgi:hypothetical protein
MEILNKLRVVLSIMQIICGACIVVCLVEMMLDKADEE